MFGLKTTKCCYLSRTWSRVDQCICRDVNKKRVKANNSQMREPKLGGVPEAAPMKLLLLPGCKAQMLFLFAPVNSHARL